MSFNGLLDDLRTAAAMPRVDIVLSRGRPREEAVLRDFRRRHPRFRVVGRKAVGVALLSLDGFADADDYLDGLRYARRRVRRAARLGYSVALFDPNQRRSEMFAIHASMPERQGRPIDPEYLDPDATYELAPDIEYIGVFRADVVVAYCKLLYTGDIVAMARVMGHGDHLEEGVMFFLTAGIVEHVKSKHPETRWVFYDMFFGAGAGLRSFKTHLGFQPHYVRWKRELSGRGGVA
ncbi:MAG: hypothetical protein ABWZ67_16010 [Solirubrobacteraceae bacterium]